MHQAQISAQGQAEEEGPEEEGQGEGVVDNDGCNALNQLNDPQSNHVPLVRPKHLLPDRLTVAVNELVKSVDSLGRNGHIRHVERHLVFVGAQQRQGEPDHELDEVVDGGEEEAEAEVEVAEELPYFGLDIVSSFEASLCVGVVIGMRVGEDSGDDHGRLSGAWEDFVGGGVAGDDAADELLLILQLLLVLLQVHSRRTAAIARPHQNTTIALITIH